MKLELFNSENNKIWKRIAESEERIDDLLQLELDFYKKLLVFFQIGESCYFIFNFQTLEFDFISNETETVLGYAAGEMSKDRILEIIHPDDREWFTHCQEQACIFTFGLPPERQMKYKLRFDYRVKKKNGEYITVMHQSVIIHIGEKGEIFRTLVVLTDISHLKKNGPFVMSYIGMDGAPSYFNVTEKNHLTSSDEILSRREKEVLYHLAEGKSSKMICQLLKISKYTVDFHRKNILRKTALNNTDEAVAKAIREGWI